MYQYDSAKEALEAGILILVKIVMKDLLAKVGSLRGQAYMAFYRVTTNTKSKKYY